MVSSVTATRYLVLMVLSIPAGIWVSARRKGPLLLVPDSLRCGLACVLAAVALTVRSVPLPLILLTLIGDSVSSVLFRAAYTPLLLASVEREDLSHTYALMELADTIATLVGPVVAGIVATTFGDASLLAVMALCFGGAAVSLLPFRDVPGPSPPPTVKRDIWVGMRLLFAEGPATAVSIMWLALDFLAVGIDLLVIVLAQRTLHASATGAGFILASMGVGGIATSTLIGLLHKTPWGDTLTLSALGVAIATAGFAIVHGVTLTALAAVVFDGCLAMGFVIAQSARALTLPSQRLSEAQSSFAVLTEAVRFSGTTLAGIVAQLVTIRRAFLVYAAILLCATLGTRAYLSGTERIRSDPPTAQ